MLNESLFSSDKDDWETPKYLYNKLNEEFNFTLDPCCTIHTKKCEKYFTIEDDGLIQPWFGTVFMNPPYGRGISKWMEKAKYECDNNNVTIVCLVPARTDTKWWHNYSMKSSEIRFLSKRLTFEGANNKATFPAALVIFKPNYNSPFMSSYII